MIPLIPLFLRERGNVSDNHNRQRNRPRAVVAKLTEVSLQDGPWYTAPNWDGRQTCVDRVEIEVEVRRGAGLS